MTDVCAFEDLIPGRGRAALIGDTQVAIFRMPFTDELYAVSNFDPFSQAYVMSRGIVGSRGDAPKVAGPIFKQSFDLRTGECFDDPTVRLESFAVSVIDGRVQVGL